MPIPPISLLSSPRHRTPWLHSSVYPHTHNRVQSTRHLHRPVPVRYLCAGHCSLAIRSTRGSVSSLPVYVMDYFQCTRAYDSFSHSGRFRRPIFFPAVTSASLAQLSTTSTRLYLCRATPVSLLSSPRHRLLRPPPIRTHARRSRLSTHHLHQPVDLLQQVLLSRHVYSTKRRAQVQHLASKKLKNPTAFLNLARALSKTLTIALFPGNLAVVPPKSF